MSINYSSDKISVTTVATTLSPSHDIIKVSLYPDAGEILFRVKNSKNKSYGDWVSIPEGVPFDEILRCSKVQIKSLSGTVLVYYYLGGV